MRIEKIEVIIIIPETTWSNYDQAARIIFQGPKS